MSGTLQNKGAAKATVEDETEVVRERHRSQYEMKLKSKLTS